MDNRIKYYDIVTVDNINERDISNAPWRFLSLSREVLYRRARRNDGPRIDLLAWDKYENVYLWWYILIANRVVDPFEGIEVGDEGEVGTLLVIPDPRDLYEFYDERKKFLINVKS